VATCVRDSPASKAWDSLSRSVRSSTSITSYYDAVLHTSEDSVTEFDSREVIVKLWRGDERIVFSLTGAAVIIWHRKKEWVNIAISVIRNLWHWHMSRTPACVSYWRWSPRIELRGRWWSCRRSSWRRTWRSRTNSCWIRDIIALSTPLFRRLVYKFVCCCVWFLLNNASDPLRFRASAVHFI
jgi:hypothetical protein